MIKTLLSIGFLTLLIGTDVFALSSNEEVRVNTESLVNQQVRNLKDYNLIKTVEPMITTVSVNSPVDNLEPQIYKDTYNNYPMSNDFNGPRLIYPFFIIGKSIFIIMFLGFLTFVVRSSWVLASKKK